VCVWKLEHKTDNIAHKDIERTTDCSAMHFSISTNPNWTGHKTGQGTKDKATRDTGHMCKRICELKVTITKSRMERVKVKERKRSWPRL